MSAVHELLNAYFNQNDSVKRSEIEDSLWQQYGVEGAVMVTDMSGFSKVTQSHGIVYYLSMIQKMRDITTDIVLQYRGKLIKFVADNAFVHFDTTQQAMMAAVAINQALTLINSQTPDMWDIKISTGIDHGRYLHIQDGVTYGGDIYGDVVNCASKLGEDISSSGEILITERAVSTLHDKTIFDLSAVEFAISGIALSAFLIN